MYHRICQLPITGCQFITSYIQIPLTRWYSLQVLLPILLSVMMAMVVLVLILSSSVFSWSPTNSLVNANTLTPTAGPRQTTTYTLMVRDTTARGCPKPVYDTVTVKVIPPVHVFAGNDTNVVVRQPLQLKAIGAEFY